MRVVDGVGVAATTSRSRSAVVLLSFTSAAINLYVRLPNGGVTSLYVPLNGADVLENISTKLPLST